MRRGSERGTGATRGGASLTDTSRGVSITVDYTLTLAIATLVVTSLFITGGNFVADQREEVVRTELQVIGQHVAADVARADRLGQAGASGTRVALNTTLPGRVSGVGYTVDVDSSGTIRLTAPDQSVSVAVEVDTAADLQDTRVSGGNLLVVYESGELEVTA
jgi:hypothetical protein